MRSGAAATARFWCCRTGNCEGEDADPPVHSRTPSFDNADIGQVAVLFGVVGAVADHEQVGDRETDKIDRDFDLELLRVVEQGTCSAIGDPAPSR